jgi:hypothetical protein
MFSVPADFYTNHVNCWKIMLKTLNFMEFLSVFLDFGHFVEKSAVLNSDKRWENPGKMLGKLLKLIDWLNELTGFSRWFSGIFLGIVLREIH